ncbi:MAG: pyruvate oxidoreductase subunit gamma [Chloroflexi bacterium]|nr:pyruvate oxidoreductase subunit gamma [Chloroflexota bacterium]
MQKDLMIEIRWHGRGGQGAVTSAELTALAAIHEGKFAQAFPSFGPERRGAPVLAFNRISQTGHIRVRAAVNEPDIVIVLDPGLLYITDVTLGLKREGALVINTSKAMSDIKSEFGGTWKLAIVNATAIAREVLGVSIVNTTMLGALVKATDIFELESLDEPVKERFGARARSNLEACRRAYEEVIIAEPVASDVKRSRTAQVEVLPGWKELLPGCPVVEPGNASQYRTGDWRSQHPVYDYQKCNKCGLCYIFCPEGCVELRDDGYFTANLYYCKGCGICSAECPKDAITMVEETQ